MTQKKQYLAVDLGAESGRVMLGTVSAEKLSLEEIFRFANNPIEEDGHLRWNFDGLFSQIKTGIAEAIKQSDGEISGIGVDSWGVDFGLLDENGELIATGEAILPGKEMIKSQNGAAVRIRNRAK